RAGRVAPQAAEAALRWAAGLGPEVVPVGFLPVKHEWRRAGERKHIGRDGKDRPEPNWHVPARAQALQAQESKVNCSVQGMTWVVFLPCPQRANHSRCR